MNNRLRCRVLCHRKLLRYLISSTTIILINYVQIKALFFSKKESIWYVSEQYNETIYNLTSNNVQDPVQYSERFVEIGNSSEKILSPASNNWVKSLEGNKFVKYRAHIDEKIDQLRIARKKQFDALKGSDAKKDAVCSQPLWKGEFGIELRLFVPWAYYKSIHGCLQISTSGMRGSKYMYWFSDTHTMVSKSSHRIPQSLPENNPFRAINVHFHDDKFPSDAEWQSPPYKDFFTNPEMVETFEEKPLVIIQNKYTEEWEGSPVNFMSKELLIRVLEYLTPNYTVLYKRYTDKALADNQEIFDLGEKSDIREKFSSVVFYEDIQEGLIDENDQNLLTFALMSLANHFLSVQGGTAVISSYFGGRSTILIKHGKEIHSGDYTYFHRFSNATVTWKFNEPNFLNHIKAIM